MNFHRIDRRRFTVGILATLIVGPTTRVAFARQELPSTPLEQLALTFTDGNGYSVTGYEGWYQFQGGVLVDERLDPAVAQSILEFNPIDVYATTTSLQNTAEYYPTMVSGRLMTFSSDTEAATYVERVLDDLVIPEITANPSIGTDYEVVTQLPDSDGAITGWTFNAFASDGGQIPGVRFVAQVGITVVSITVISQNPDTADSAARELTQTQTDVVQTEQPVESMLFPGIA